MALRIIDLTGAYEKDVLANHDVAAYEAVLPEFFEHYYAYWASRKHCSPRLDRALLKERARCVVDELPRIEAGFSRLKIPLDPVSLVLFVGQGTSNGHALHLQSSFAAWMALECYPSALAVACFLPHELAHAAHYESRPEFYFRTRSEQAHTGRQLIIEGIATRIAMLVTGLSESAALWGDLLGEEALREWMGSCLGRRRQLASFVLEHFDSSLPGNPLFTASRSGDILENRGGYYCGLHAVLAIEEGHGISVGEMLQLHRSEAETLFRDALSSVLRA